MRLFLFPNAIGLFFQGVCIRIRRLLGHIGLGVGVLLCNLGGVFQIVSPVFERLFAGLLLLGVAGGKGKGGGKDKDGS